MANRERGIDHGGGGGGLEAGANRSITPSRETPIPGGANSGGGGGGMRRRGR